MTTKGLDIDHLGAPAARMPQFASVPIIVISARDPRETEVRAPGAGATCFLPKPLDLVEFAETVIRLSGRSGRPPHASVDLRESPPLDAVSRGGRLSSTAVVRTDGCCRPEPYGRA